MTAVAWFVLTIAVGGLFLISVIVLIRQARGRRARGPFPYPGCVACKVALADDVDDREHHGAHAGQALELHQMAEHTGGPRW